MVKDQLAPTPIADVIPTEAEGFDGDPILRVQVVLGEKDHTLDPDKVLELGRLAWIKLFEEGTDRFPVFSYMTEEDVAEQLPDAAQ
ncbi:MAG: hypothetical protein OXC91_10370 [Rhodobacteraceae bacterium]|nr:hypothetical protein [Paracoccaceae bacterium]